MSYSEITTALSNALETGPEIAGYKYAIAASVYDPQGRPYPKPLYLRRNGLPPLLQGKIEPNAHLGDSGPTVHAETRLIAEHGGVKLAGKGVMVSDPPCPNCMKAMIGAGISEVLILSHGFDHGIWYNSVDEAGIKRACYFQDVSVLLAQQAGVAVSRVSAAGKVEEVLSPQNNDAVDNLGYAHVEKLDSLKQAQACFDANRGFWQGHPHAASLSTDPAGNLHLLITREQYLGNMTHAKAQALRDRFEGQGGLRYRLMLDPLSGLLSAAAAYGLSLAGQTPYVSELPTARCIVNALDGDITGLRLASLTPQSEKGQQSLIAMEALQKISALSVTESAPEFD